MGCIIITDDLRDLAKSCGMEEAECANLVGLWQEHEHTDMETYPDAETLRAFRASLRSGASRSAMESSAQGTKSEEAARYPSPAAESKAMNDARSAAVSDLDRERAENTEALGNAARKMSGSSSQADYEQAQELYKSREGYFTDDWMRRTAIQSGQGLRKRVAEQTGVDEALARRAVNEVASQRSHAYGRRTSAAQEMVGRLTGDDRTFNDYIDSEYRPYSPFYRSGRWANSWLREMEETPEVRQNMEVQRGASFTQKPASTWTRADADRANMDMYFSAESSGGINYAWYQMPGTNDYIKFRRYSGSEKRDGMGVPVSYKSTITDALQDVMATEYNRIREIQNHIGKREDIPVYDDMGTQFLYMPEINSYTTEDGRRATSIIHELLNADDYVGYDRFTSSMIRDIMNRKLDISYAEWERNGALNGRTREQAEEYLWNSELARTQMLQLMTSDIAFFEDSSAINRYISGLTAEGTVLEDDGMPSGGVTSTATSMTASISSQNDSARLGLRSVPSLREMMIKSKQWTENMEKAYQEWQNGTLSPMDHRIIRQPARYTINTFSEIEGSDGSLIKAPVQIEAVDNIDLKRKDEGQDVTFSYDAASSAYVPADGVAFSVPYSNMIIQESDMEAAVMDAMSPVSSDMAMRAGDATLEGFQEAMDTAADFINSEDFLDPATTVERQKEMTNNLKKAMPKAAGARMQVTSWDRLSNNGETILAEMPMYDSSTDTSTKRKMKMPKVSQTKDNTIAVFATTKAGNKVAFPAKVIGYTEPIQGPMLRLSPQAEAKYGPIDEAQVFFPGSGVKIESQLESEPSVESAEATADYIYSLTHNDLNTTDFLKRSGRYTSAAKSAAKAMNEGSFASAYTKNAVFSLRTSRNVSFFGRKARALNKSPEHTASRMREWGKADLSSAYILNISPATVDMASMLFGMGYNAREVALYLNQPIIRDITTEYMNRGDPASLHRVITDITGLYLSYAGEEAMQPAADDDIDFSRDEYIKFITASAARSLTKKQAAQQALIGMKFERLMDSAHDTATVNRAIANMDIADTAIDVIYRAAELSRLSSLHNIFYINNNSSVSANERLLTSAAETVAKKVPQVRGNMLRVAEEVFSYTNSNGRVTAEMINDMLGDLSSYMLSVGHGTYTNEDYMDYIINKIPHALDAALSSGKMAGNAFLNSLKVEGGAYHPSIIFRDGTDIASLTEDERNKLSSAWGDLLETGPYWHKLATDLFQYALRQGFNNESLASLAPTQVRNATPAYLDGLHAIELVAEGRSDVWFGVPRVMQQFVDQYCLNHLHEISSPVSDATRFMRDNDFVLDIVINPLDMTNDELHEIVKYELESSDTSLNITFNDMTYYDYLSVERNGKTAYYRLNRPESERTGSAIYDKVSPLGDGRMREYDQGFDIDQFESHMQEGRTLAAPKVYEMDEADAIRDSLPQKISIEGRNDAYDKLMYGSDDITYEDRVLENYDSNENFTDDEGKPICK